MSNDVLMGITVEEVSERIKRLATQGEQAEDFNMLLEMNALKEALLANPDVVNSLAEEDLGAMVVAYRQIHSDAFASTMAKRAPKEKKAKGSTAAEIKAAAKMTASEVDLDAL